MLSERGRRTGGDVETRMGRKLLCVALVDGAGSVIFSWMLFTLKDAETQQVDYILVEAYSPAPPTRSSMRLMTDKFGDMLKRPSSGLGVGQSHLFSY